MVWSFAVAPVPRSYMRLHPCGCCWGAHIQLLERAASVWQACGPSAVPFYLQYLHQESSYNSILVWKDDKDPMGVRIPGT